MAKYSHYLYDKEYTAATYDARLDVEIAVERRVFSSYRITIDKLGNRVNIWK